MLKTVKAPRMYSNENDAEWKRKHWKRREQTERCGTEWERMKKKLTGSLKSFQRLRQYKAMTLADRCYHCPVEPTFPVSSGASEMHLSPASNIGSTHVYQFYCCPF